MEDEGQYLQDVYPIGKVYGGAGKFGFDPRAHLTEASELLTPENAVRLRQSWERHWDQSKPIRVEKTPGNLLKTRFLQAAFPNSYFIVIRRHPVAVSLATQRWKVSLVPLHNLFEHWLHCHALFEKDKEHLKRVYELTYENYVEDPDKYHQEIARFIGTRVPKNGMEETTGVHNKKYFDRWSNLLKNSLFKSYYRYLVIKYDARVGRYGYLLKEGFDVSDRRLKGGKVSCAVGPLYCLGADIGAFVCRFSVRVKAQFAGTAKAVLPNFIVTRIRQARQRASRSKGRADVSS
jgi:hypothetical protein